MKLVLAGDYNEFLFYCREQNISPRDKSVRYISDPIQAAGYINFEVVKYGRWYQKRWEPGFLEELEFRGKIKQ
jgi:hypothetical protein